MYGKFAGTNALNRQGFECGPRDAARLRSELLRDLFGNI
jgi:hypothetical protein